MIRVMCIALLLTGCTLSQVKITKDIGCIVVTEESRAEIRAKQNLKTNICGDDLNAN